MQVIVLGGGAAGFFAAVNAKLHHPDHTVILIEKSAVLLSKVKISGGGRCNVTHACFDPKILIQNYPRGGKELLGPFHRFQPADTIEWFESRGVALKTEADGRMFPITDNSATIINCLMEEALKLGVSILTRQKVDRIEKAEGKFILFLEQLSSRSDSASQSQTLTCDKLILCTGSSPQGFNLAKSLGHSIQEPIPSLFTFNIPSFSLVDLAGVSVENAIILLSSTKNFTQSGPLLITHWGFSGPAALKLSAWGARVLYENDYKMDILIDWLPDINMSTALYELQLLRKEGSGHYIGNQNPFGIPKKLWKRQVELTILKENKTYKEASNDDFIKLCQKLKSDRYEIQGKTTYKEEFVTCGGVTLSEVNFKTMESKICPGLFFAGEILDIDAVTGGFNFQNAWTTAWIASHHLA